MTLRLNGVHKRFGNLVAVDGVSLEVPQGSLFGFLGSNGAGKTTTIRMILRVLLPDAGSMTWQGNPITDETARRFGYLPEERGLYPKMKVADQLTYLATLHGLSRSDAAASVNAWLERLEMGPYRDKRVDQLSKGNQQKIQFIAAVAHRPPLVILDEPFSGLDPLNSQVLEESLKELQAQGTTVIFSSHRLEQVESLCTHAAMMHRGRLLTAGTIGAIKRQAGRKVVRLAVEGPLDFLYDLPGVRVVRETPQGSELAVSSEADAQAVLRAAVAAGPVRRFELDEPSLTEIYLERVRGAAS